ncbi:competence type IV pilus assembly protein ComGB [Streptococcus sp.]|nr:competence type IV pilus assembly protein ComGB [Streptococcus sp.]
MKNFLTKERSLFQKKSQKALKIEQQKKIIQLFSNLYSSGFHLSEVVTFLEHSRLLAPVYIKRMQSSLVAGKNLSQIMAELSFSEAVVTQLSLSEIHGNVSLSLEKIESHLEQIISVRKKLFEVASYPFILLIFLVVIMLGLRQYLLPQLEGDNLAVKVLNQLPQIFLMTVMCLFFTVILARWYFKRKSRLASVTFWSKVPVIRSYVRLYLTAYYAREWGNLLGQGLEIPQIIKIMTDQPKSLFKEVGEDLEKAFLSGHSFHEQILSYSFFLPELSLMIEYGQIKAKLGSELEIYAQEKWETFFQKINASMQIIQPIVFIFVALMIVMIYAAMLLPMYQNMEVQF